MEQVGLIVGWVGLVATAFGAIVAGVRALIRGPREDKSLEAELQDRVTAMAERWLDQAEKRLKEAEDVAENARKRATEAESQLSKVLPRVAELEQSLFSALTTIGYLWPWGLSGGGEPRPVLPAWIYEWLHKQGKGA